MRPTAAVGAGSPRPTPGRRGTNPQSPVPNPSARRRLLLGLAHKAAQQLGWDDDFRRQLQEESTGHASCRDMSDAQLVSWCWHLKDLGADIGIPGKLPDRGPWRPTSTQMAEIERLVLARGWDGLEDPRLCVFMRKTVKVEAARFLTKWQATAVIVGLRRWQKTAQPQPREGQ